MEDLYIEQNVAKVGVRTWNPSTPRTHILSPVSDHDRNSEPPSTHIAPMALVPQDSPLL